MSVVRPGAIGDWMHLRQKGAVSPESLDRMFESMKTYLESEIAEVIRSRKLERERLEEHTIRYEDAKRREGAGAGAAEEDVATYEGICLSGLVTPKITKKLPEKELFLERLRFIAQKYLENGNAEKAAEVRTFATRFFSHLAYR